MRLPRNIELKRDQILILVKKDFKLKYDSTMLGMLWSIITPLAMSGIYYFVFGKIMNFGSGNFALYIISGTFLWHYFSAIVMQNGGVLKANSALLKKTAFDRRLLVWSVYWTETMHFCLTIPILAALALVFGVRPNPLHFIANLVISMLSLMWFAVGIGYIFAALNLVLRDSKRILDVVFKVWFYASPVFIPGTRIPPEYSFIYDYNPMALIMYTWRDAFYEPAFHPERFPTILAVGLVTFVLGRWLFMRYEPRFAEKM